MREVEPGDGSWVSLELKVNQLTVEVMGRKKSTGLRL